MSEERQVLWTRSQVYPPGQQWRWSEQHIAWRGGGNKVNEVTVWINELFLNNTT